MNESTREIAGVVLCGGMSQRMGLPKCDLPFGDETMLERIVRLVESVVSNVVVVAADGQQVDLPNQICVVRDRYSERGPLEGIAVGLEAASEQSDLAFVTSCDVPLLVPGLVGKLASLIGDHHIVAIDDGQFQHPLCAVYRTELFATARALIDQGIGSARSLLAEEPTRFVGPEELADVDPSLQSLRNINSPDEYVAVAQAAGVHLADDVLQRLGLQS